DSAALDPVLALHVEDEVAGSDLRHPASDRGDPADAFSTGCGRQLRPQAIAAAAERDICRVDRESQHVKDDFTWAGRADIRHFDTARYHFGRTIRGEIDPLHQTLPVAAD